jgi:hypothetical protein
MNHDPLHELWHSTANKPDAAAERRAAEQFAARWRRQRRWQALWLAWTFLALSAAAALAFVQLRRGSVTLGEQTMLVPLFGVPWLAAVHFLRKFLQHGAALPHAGQPFAEVVRSAEQANTSERHRLRVIGVLLVTMAPVTALAVWQLHAAGKASVSEAWSMAAVFALGLALGLTAVAWRYRTCLQPERRLITARLRELEAISST